MAGGPFVDPVVMDCCCCPETRARLSKERSFWIAFCLFRKMNMNHSTVRPMIARNTSPPTTPPAIAPALDRDLPADAEVLEVLDEADEEVPVETLVLVDIADEVVEVVVLARSA